MTRRQDTGKPGEPAQGPLVDLRETARDAKGRLLDDSQAPDLSQPLDRRFSKRRTRKARTPGRIETGEIDRVRDDRQ